MFFKQFYENNKLEILLVSILGILSSIISILPPFTIRWYIDSVLKNSNIELILFAFLLIFLAYIFGEFLKSIFIYLCSKVSLKLFISIKNKTFKTLLNMPYSDFRKRYNQNLNIFLNDIKSIQTIGIETLPEMIVSLFIGIGAAVYLFTISPIFLICTFFISTFSLIPLFFINKRQGKLIEETHINEQNMTNYIKDFLDKPLLVKIINSENFILNGLKTRAELLMFSSLKRELNFRTFLVIRVFFDALIPAFVFGVGAYLYHTNKISLGHIIASLLIIPSITKPVNNITSYYLVLKDFIPRFNRVNELMNIPVETEQGVAKIPDSKTLKIEFDNVTYKLDGEIILKEISFVIEEGQHTLITGDSGSGKSTIFNLLLNLYQPSNGNLKINSIDYSQFTNFEIRKIFAITAQDVFFLNGTILNNLKAMNENANDLDIQKAIYYSCSDEFIDKLPLGIHTHIGEDGNKLSGGQLQRLSIARSLLTNPKFLLLDEATSALNVELEKKIFNRLYSLKDITIIQITHRKGYEDYSTQHIQLKNKKALSIDTSTRGENYEI